MRIALTFDGAPTPPHTDNVLDVLERYGVKATFFMEGGHADQYPGAARRVVEAGHEIGNHTYGHRPLDELSQEEVRAEILRAEEAIQKATGVRTRLFRPPWGRSSALGDQILREMGYEKVMWSFGARDWEYPGHEAISRVLLDQAGDGSIVVLHDHVDQVPRALEAAIPVLLERGFRFVLVSEIGGRVHDRTDDQESQAGERPQPD